MADMFTSKILTWWNNPCNCKIQSEIDWAQKGRKQEKKICLWRLGTWTNVPPNQRLHQTQPAMFLPLDSLLPPNPALPLRNCSQEKAFFPKYWRFKPVTKRHDNASSLIKHPPSLHLASFGSIKLQQPAGRRGKAVSNFRALKIQVPCLPCKKMREKKEKEKKEEEEKKEEK